MMHAPLTTAAASTTIKHLFFINHKINIQLDFLWQVGVAFGRSTMLAYFTLLISMQTIFYYNIIATGITCVPPRFPSTITFPLHSGAVLHCQRKIKTGMYVGV